MYLLKLSNSEHHALIDDEDMPWVCQWTWFLKSHMRMQHVARSQREGDRVKTIYLHRAIMGVACEGFDVHHRNGNIFDNRRINLETVTGHHHFTPVDEIPF